jgi:predicted NBD/HSP70 family sugar kinase
METRFKTKVLVVDIGGTNVKILATGQAERRRFPSGRTLTPRQMVSKVKELASDWEYEVVSIGYPGRVVNGEPSSEPRNLGPGWVGFDFVKAFGCPVQIVNDAAMQALGNYKGGRMLFLGLGTGFGSSLIVDGVVVPMEWGHFSYRSGTIEDYLGVRALKRMGKKKWSRHFTSVIIFINEVFHADTLVIGGGNAKKLKNVHPACRIGSNADAFVGGFRLWEERADSQGGKGMMEIVTGRKKKTVAHAWRCA